MHCNKKSALVTDDRTLNIRWCIRDSISNSRSRLAQLENILKMKDDSSFGVF